MKTLIKGILGFTLPAFLAYLVSGNGNWALTLGILVLGYLVSAFIFRANVLMFIGTRVYHSNPEKGLKIFSLAYKTRKLSPSYQLIYAYILIRNGKLDLAENVMNKAVVLGKHTLKEAEFKACDFNRALITWKRGDISAAIVELEDLYEVGYKTPAFFGTLGSFYLMNKEFSKAETLAKEGVEYNATDLVSRDNLGQAYIEQGMLDEAEAVYDELLPQNPKFMEAYYNYATIMEKRGNLEKAKKNYEMALAFEEKFLSTITHDQICEAINRVSELMI